MIVIVNASSRARPHWSLARTRIEYDCLVSKSKLAFVSSRAPSIWNEELSVSPAPLTSENVNVAPRSGSVAPSVPTSVPAGWFSATDAFDSVRSVGAWLTTKTTRCWIRRPELPIRRVGGHCDGCPTQRISPLFDGWTQKYVRVFRGSISRWSRRRQSAGLSTSRTRRSGRTQT